MADTVGHARRRRFVRPLHLSQSMSLVSAVQCCLSLFTSYSNVGGSGKRPDQPCSSSSLQSKRSRENSDIGGEYIPPCSPFHKSLNPVLQFLH